KNLIAFKGEHFVSISFIDYLSAKIFLNYKKKYDPEFSVLFLNGIAHLQHHHWDELNYKDNKPLKYGLKYIDRVLKDIFAALGREDIFMMMTALSQENTNTDPSWYLYRQRDQANFLNRVGIPFETVEPHMTYDAHIFFSTEADCNNAIHILQNAQIRG